MYLIVITAIAMDDTRNILFTASKYHLYVKHFNDLLL